MVVIKEVLIHVVLIAQTRSIVSASGRTPVAATLRPRKAALSKLHAWHALKDILAEMVLLQYFQPEGHHFTNLILIL